MTTISSALAAAILQARQQNPNAYANVASNYLLGAGLSSSQFQSIANTGTVNLVLPTGNYNVNPIGGNNFSLKPISNTLSGIASSFLSPSLPSTTGTNLPGSTSGGSPPPAVSNSGAATDSLTTSFNSGITQAKTFLESHPEVLLIGGGIAVLLLLKK